MITTTTEPNLINTGKTIVHLGTTFKIFNVDPSTKEAKDAPYVLENKKGQQFILVRNQYTSNQLFGVHYGTLKSLKGWFCDKTGELKSIG